MKRLQSTHTQATDANCYHEHKRSVLNLGLAGGTELALSFHDAIVVGGLHEVVHARDEFDRQGPLEGVLLKFTALKGPRNGVEIVTDITADGGEVVLIDELGARNLMCGDRENLGQMTQARLKRKASASRLQRGTCPLHAETRSIGTAGNRIVLSTAHFAGDVHFVKLDKTSFTTIEQPQHNITVSNILQFDHLIDCLLSNKLPAIFVLCGTVDGVDGLEGQG